jgi:hypothetical protein
VQAARKSSADRVIHQGYHRRSLRASQGAQSDLSPLTTDDQQAEAGDARGDAMRAAGALSPTLGAFLIAGSFSSAIV